MEAAARRELLEETGYEPQKMQRLQDILWADPSCFNGTYVPWLATGCMLVREKQLDATEFAEVELIPLRSWNDSYISSGKILSAPTIAISYLAQSALVKSGYSW